MKKEFSIPIGITLLSTILLIMLAGFFCAPYFDINDDVVLKDILSGAYTGTPDSHTIQMLSPFCAFFCLLYKAVSTWNWFGIFLWTAQYFCFAVVLSKLLALIKSNSEKVILALSATVLFAGCMASHLVFVQYTVVSGVFAACAVALLLLKGDGDKNYVWATIFLWLSFLLRPEMLLINIPFVGAALVFRFFAIKKQENESKYFGSNHKKWMKNAVLFCTVTLMGFLAFYAIHKLSYSSEEWKSFTAFDDIRTELYDFQSIPSHEGNEALYSGLGLDESEYALLLNYNYGLDSEINESLISELVNYNNNMAKSHSFAVRVKESLSVYLYRLRHFSLQGTYQFPGTDFPWNILLLLLYAGCFFAFLLPKDRFSNHKLPIAFSLLFLLFAGRSSIWIFLLLRGRDPIRITHPLYLTEILFLFVVLFGRLHELYEKCEGRKKYLSALPLCALLLVSVISLPNQWSILRTEAAAREITNSHYQELYDYFADHPENYYLMDVYTSLYYHENGAAAPATYSQKIFEKQKKAVANYDLLGGWTCKSPLSDGKIKELGYSSMQDALLGEKVYLVLDSAKDTDWLSAYYSDKGQAVLIESLEDVAGVFRIYRVIPSN